ncbi:hypothetical protein ACHAPM_002404 [Fusarium culmorum]|uniref:F-box domain-containing protein n=1 Tax=Fusarium culmorum TaxID=5516 RepID=A0A2T4GT51_FUSCU|nr:hypothetical protein FCULG_00006200 [Fusarium culmorum]
MDNLPPEIIRNIVSHLIVAARKVPHINELCPITSLAPYASISQQWRDIVESITFRHLILNSRRLTEADCKNYLTPLRLSYVRYIWYDFEFPAHNLAVTTDPEDYDDQLVFNRSVRQLLEVLSRFPHRDEPVVGLEMFITPPKKFALRLLRHETKRSRERTEVLFGNVIPAYVELFEDWDKGIAEIPAVSYFRVEPGSQSILFSPSSMNRIASKMPRLSRVEWWLTDEENIDSITDITETSQRTMFSRTLEMIPTSVRSYALSYLRQPPRSAVDRVNSTVPPSTQDDIMSRSFYSFTQRIGLDDFYLLARVDSTILLPQQPKADAIWPSIRRYNLELKEHLPSGECIAQLPSKGYVYDQKIMDRFAIAAATCAARMPKIEELNVIHHGRTQMGICFNTCSEDEPCLEFFGQPDVPEPSEETLAIWKKAVKTHGLKWDVNITSEMGKVYHFY